LATLRAELLKPRTLAYITQRLEKELKWGQTTSPGGGEALRKQLEHENRKLQNLVNALADGASSPATVLKTVSEKERLIAKSGGPGPGRR
jgi:hypothetical protein